MHYSHSGDVFSWEGIGGVADKETGFPHSSGKRKKQQQEVMVVREVLLGGMRMGEILPHL